MIGIVYACSIHFVTLEFQEVIDIFMEETHVDKRRNRIIFLQQTVATYTCTSQHREGGLYIQSTMLIHRELFAHTISPFYNMLLDIKMSRQSHWPSLFHNKQGCGTCSHYGKGWLAWLLEICNHHFSLSLLTCWRKLILQVYGSYWQFLSGVLKVNICETLHPPLLSPQTSRRN